MKTLKPLAATIAVLLASSSVAATTSFNVVNKTSAGTPSFIVGDMGSTSSKSAISALKSVINAQAAFAANGNEDFKVKQQWVDELGKTHTRVEQTINGLKVYGTSMIVHTQGGIKSIAGGTSPSKLYAISGNLALNNEAAPSLSLMQSKANVAGHISGLALAMGELHGEPELAYVYLPMTDETKLAYRTEVSWDNGDGDFGRDFVFFDARSSEVVARHAQVHSAKSWRTHTLDGGSQNSAPGRLLCTNNQSCGDAAGQRAHDGASKVYDYYQAKFGRDSLDGNGMTMISSVGLGEANAYWTGTQMMYGKAMNGMRDFTSDFDIIGHELTHGVTDKTAGLRYQNASGALNEAWSDILGMSAESYKNGTTSSSWLLGDGLYINQPGKAFRYMNNPTQDNYSKDWYPDRIAFVSNPTNSNDYGGVHGNSGIANLAYTLLVDGGTHPRGKSSAVVPSIGMAKAEKIFYRALVTYMGQSTSFAGARTATAQSAQDLYGATEKKAVETAWCAVGVGACPTTGGGGNNTLENGVTKSGVSVSKGQDVVYTMDVPAGATNIKFASSGGSGDADMYVKFGATPTDSVWDCRPYVGGNTESCTGTKTGGTYYVRLKALSAF
ncbi:MAG: M4 family metallopeptidase [Psychrosphaera sp.]|nr:M4 family metallopeptidase [Psychrosphaera sp.]